MAVKHYFDFLETSVRTNWDSPALSDFDGSESLTYGQLAAEIEKLRLLFAQCGLQPGDKVAISARNCTRWAVTFLAAAAHGAVSVSILPNFSPESIHALVNHSDAKLLFTNRSSWGSLSFDAMPDLIGALDVESCQVLGSRSDALDAAAGSWQEMFSEKYPDGFSAADLRLTRFDLGLPVLINYTSGTTSDPKGVILSWRSISSNVLFGQTRIPNHAGWNMLSMLPLAHMFGLMFEFLYQLAGGCHVYFLSKTPSPQVLMKAFAEVRPYMILTVPLVIEKIFKSKIFPALQKPLPRILWHIPLANRLVRRKVYDQLMQAFGGRLLHLIIGGAALNQQVENCLRTIRFPYTIGYGMTECGPLLAYEDWQNFVLHSCGKPVHRMEVRIDSENPQRVVGEILVRGDNVMDGYYKNDEATRAIFTSDGWMRTGDLGVMDADGNIFIRGRSKNMILGPSGQNIYPEEIEEKVNNLPYVVESVVVSRNDRLVALVFADTETLRKEQPEADIAALMEQNRKAVNAKLPTFCRIAEIELVAQEFEKTPKRSIKRFLYK